jgi:DNA-binding NtrC family response regulator
MATVLCVGGETLHTRLPLLKSAGFEVLTATTERASLAAGRLPQVDAVILDTHSPIDNVTALAAELKCMRPSLPILLVSDSGVEDMLEPEVAFDRVLSRLDGPSALLDTLHDLTSGIISVSQSTRIKAQESRSESKRLRAGMAEMRNKMRHLRGTISHKPKK